ncbi:MAG: hypothetical protein F6K03_12575 [Kamptonema sp. SIO4C4]|nr:hypothetical protein [Kamptonema sp. SIO4C4]
MSSEQLNLFNTDPSEPSDSLPEGDFNPDLIPTDASIPIPAKTYPTIEALAVHCQQCQRCELAGSRTHVVIGRGNPQADILIVGEGPGQHEDEQGLPFVGRSGQLLDKILASVNFDPEKDVYIANMVKCLTAETAVLTREGYKTIGSIVKQQWQGEVLSLDPQKKLVWRPVTGWYESPLGSRTLYEVKYAGQDVGYTATGDHPILTRRGWIPVEDLHAQDLAATGTPMGDFTSMQQILQGIRDRVPKFSSSLTHNFAGQKTDWRPVTKVKPSQPESSSSVYCIDVAETANFVTPAGVVHNCRPPQNRTPVSEEIAACKPYLLEQIRLIDPKIILFTGATAYKGLTGKKQGITKIRGQWLEWEGRQCMAIFHPAYLLRNPSREKGKPKWLMWQDIQAVRQKLDELR